MIIQQSSDEQLTVTTSHKEIHQLGTKAQKAHTKFGIRSSRCEIRNTKFGIRNSKSINQVANQNPSYIDIVT